MRAIHALLLLSGLCGAGARAETAAPAGMAWIPSGTYAPFYPHNVVEAN